MFASHCCAGLYPSDDLEAAKCDSVLDCATDFGVNIRPSFIEKDQAKKVRKGARPPPNC